MTVQVVVTLLVVAWAVRLGSFLFLRVLRTGKDSRFDELKDDPRASPSLPCGQSYRVQRLHLVCRRSWFCDAPARASKELTPIMSTVCCNHAVKFFVVWTGQAVWVWVTLLPVLILNATERDPRLRWSDVVGGIIWGAGFVCELTADLQKQRWRKDPAHKGRFINVGELAAGPIHHTLHGLSRGSGPFHHANAIVWSYCMSMVPLPER